MISNLADPSYILHVVEAERRSPARVLQGLGGESLVVAVDETEIYLDSVFFFL